MSDNTKEQERAVVEAVAKAGHIFHGTAEWFIKMARSAGYVLVERADVDFAASDLEWMLGKIVDEFGGNEEVDGPIRALASRLRRAAAPGNGEGT